MKKVSFSFEITKINSRIFTKRKIVQQFAALYLQQYKSKIKEIKCFPKNVFVTFKKFLYSCRIK